MAIFYYFKHGHLETLNEECKEIKKGLAVKTQVLTLLVKLNLKCKGSNYFLPLRLKIPALESGCRGDRRGGVDILLRQLFLYLIP